MLIMYAKNTGAQFLLRRKGEKQINSYFVNHSFKNVSVQSIVKSYNFNLLSADFAVKQQQL